MAQHDQQIEDGSGAVVRADINAAFAALFSSSSGPAEPLVTVPGQLWFNSEADSLAMRDGLNTGWSFLANYDPANDFFTEAQADARFAAVNTVYTKAEYDARFAGLGSRYTKAEVDAKFNPLLDPIFAPSTDPTKRTHFDLSGITAGQDRAIRVGNAPMSIGGWELISDDIVSGGLVKDYKDLAAFHTIEICGEYNPVSVANYLKMWVSSDNGASWITTANHCDLYMYGVSGGTATAGNARSTVNGFEIGLQHPIPPSDANYGMVFTCRLFGFNRADRWTRASIEHGWLNNTSSTYYRLETTSWLPVAVACNALHFVSADGAALWNGRLTLHGLRS